MSKVTVIKDEMKLAMKNKEKERLSTLRMALSALEKEKVSLKLDTVEKLSDEQVDVILVKQVKMLDQELDSLVNAGRETGSVLRQKEVINEFLPKQLTEEEITEIVTTKITELGIGSVKEQGKLMGVLSKELKGKADMGKVSKIVREVLN